jgi:rare lipoprotein A
MKKVLLMSLLGGMCWSGAFVTPQRDVSLAAVNQAATTPTLRTKAGNASYYGPNFHLRSRTASGELMNMYALTAAHPTLPFGTHVKVTNATNGKSVIVRINDRGPYHGSRIIDLSLGAFKRIAKPGRGTIQVKLRVIPQKTAQIRQLGAGLGSPVLPPMKP